MVWVKFSDLFYFADGACAVPLELAACSECKSIISGQSTDVCTLSACRMPKKIKVRNKIHEKYGQLYQIVERCETEQFHFQFRFVRLLSLLLFLFLRRADISGTRTQINIKNEEIDKTTNLKDWHKLAADGTVWSDAFASRLSKRGTYRFNVRPDLGADAGEARHRRVVREEVRDEDQEGEEVVRTAERVDDDLVLFQFDHWNRTVEKREETFIPLIDRMIALRHISTSGYIAP